MASQEINIAVTRHLFSKACEQIVILNTKVNDTRIRHHQAQNVGNRSASYSLLMRLNCIEGILALYYRYACNRADEIDAWEQSTEVNDNAN